MKPREELSIFRDVTRRPALGMPVRPFSPKARKSRDVLQQDDTALSCCGRVIENKHGSLQMIGDDVQVKKLLEKERHYSSQNEKRHARLYEKKNVPLWLGLTRSQSAKTARESDKTVTLA